MYYWTADTPDFDLVPIVKGPQVGVYDRIRQELRTSERLFRCSWKKSLAVLRVSSVLQPDDVVMPAGHYAFADYY
jgi:hypothetical protein